MNRFNKSVDDWLAYFGYLRDFWATFLDAPDLLWKLQQEVGEMDDILRGRVMVEGWTLNEIQSLQKRVAQLEAALGERA